jgi:hypothetical protein
VLDGTANPDGPGLLVRGREYEPVLLGELEARPAGGLQTAEGAVAAGGPRAVGGPGSDLDPFVVNALIRLARLAGAVGDALRDCPDPGVRRSAAVLAARAYPVRAAFDA